MLRLRVRRCAEWYAQYTRTRKWCWQFHALLDNGPDRRKLLPRRKSSTLCDCSAVSRCGDCERLSYEESAGAKCADRGAVSTLRMRRARAERCRNSHPSRGPLRHAKLRTRAFHETAFCDSCPRRFLHGGRSKHAERQAASRLRRPSGRSWTLCFTGPIWMRSGRTWVWPAFPSG
jgi:hypothetical protein